MIKKIFQILIILSYIIQAQVGYVGVEHSIYKYLNRMKSLHIIDNYDPFEIPKSRKDITNYLKEINKSRNELSSIDNKILSDYLIEFEFDLNYSTNDYYSLFEDTSHTPLFFNQKEKFLYFYTDSTNFNTFINFVGSGEGLYSINNITETNQNATLFTFGFEARGTVHNNFGYFIHATNGSQYGDKELGAFKSNLKYNYKYNEGHDSTNSFDETFGYLSAEFDHLRFKIGRDRVNIGYGNSKIIMDNYAPPMDYISMQINYSIFTFTFLHGKLYGNTNAIYDATFGSYRTINDKYIAYHRLSLNFSKHFQLGLGEMVIYSNRNVDLAYLNPFNFYKSAEHANQDRDNALLFIDFKNNSFKGLSLFGTFLIDDVDFSKLGTKWYGNKFLYDFGFSYEIFPSLFPLTITSQYLRIDPYVYSHRIYDNNYTSMAIELASNIQPNSEALSYGLIYKPHYRVELELDYQYVIHGANEIDKDGNVIVNYGGDILVGHRTGDSDEVVFLDGVEETSSHFVFTVKYEPYKNYIFSFRTDFIKNKQEGIETFNQIISNLILSIRI